jgi:microcystin-dependent protein
MPALTPLGFPYPLAADPPTMQSYFQELAEAIDDYIANIPPPVIPPSAVPVPVGVMAMWGGIAAPTNWLFCRGQAVDRTTYADLFAVYGTRYGAGNGTTTFNLPNFMSRGPIGVSDGTAQTDSAGNAIGNLWILGPGEKAGYAPTNVAAHSHVMTHGHAADDTLAGDHFHTIPARLDPVSGSLGSLGTSNAGGTISTRNSNASGTHHHDIIVANFTGNTADAGGTLPAGNYQPGLAVNFIVKALAG